MLPLSKDDQHTLLRLARQALEEGVRHSRLPEIETPPETLCQKCGAFVTLLKAGRLRGCIGYIEAMKPLYQTVCECALASALRDPRFDPVDPSEIPSLRLEISVLSPPVDISPEQIEVGRHGLLVSRGLLRGVLLPQVAVEWKWNSQQFLEETCLKAGLPPDAWRHGTRIQAFTAQVFGETRESAQSSAHAA